MSPALIELRESAGKSRAQVAADMQMSERHLYRLERRTTPLSRRWALAFAAYYQVTVADIDEAAERGGA